MTSLRQTASIAARLVFVLAMLLGPAIASAWAQSPQRQQISGPANHGPSGLVLPAELATARLAAMTDFEPAAPGLGAAYSYPGSRGAITDIYIYNKRGTVPDGAGNATIQAEARQALADIDTLAQRGIYADVNKPTSVSACKYGAVDFACITLDFRQVQANRKVGSIIAVRGVRGHFVKLRLSWPYGDDAAADEARAVLAAFAAHLATQR